MFIMAREMCERCDQAHARHGRWLNRNQTRSGWHSDFAENASIALGCSSGRCFISRIQVRQKELIEKRPRSLICKPLSLVVLMRTLLSIFSDGSRKNGERKGPMSVVNGA